MTVDNNAETLQQAHEVYDKLLYTSEQLRVERSGMARLILSEQIDNYLDFALQFDLVPLLGQIAKEDAE